MALNASKYPPKSTTDLITDGVLQPVPYQAVAGDPAVEIFNGEISELLGGEAPQPITIHIGNDNLVDLIASLTARIEDLETP